MEKTSQVGTKKSIGKRLLEAVFGAGAEGSAPAVKAESIRGSGTGSYRFLGTISYTGEKNQGEMGPVKDYVLDYVALRSRSWALLLESEISQIVISKMIMWIIGPGLKLQSEPAISVLEDEGITLDADSFSKTLESRFSLFKNDNMSDFSDMTSLSMMESVAQKNALVGGDVLVVLRVVDGVVKTQLIDGALVISPMFGSDWYPYVLKNGNRIVHGIEIAPNGEHVAFYVRKTTKLGDLSYETDRIQAKGRKTGLKMAYMVYGMKYRIDNHRGMPLMSVVMENIKQLDRYKSATVGSAEERQKIPYTIEHPYPHSTGENPLLQDTAFALSGGSPGDDIPFDDFGDQLEKRVASTSNKNVYNLPIGAAMKAVDSKNELYFTDFYDTNLKLICASVNLPLDVAMSLYNNSFSASRAALKDWENTLLTKRKEFSFQFLQPILNLFLHVMVLTGKVKANGYMDAFNDENVWVISAYRKARFAGVPVPHIDPEKEVRAERLKLGSTGEHIPLTTAEASTEVLNGGDFDANLVQYARELEETNELGIEVLAPPLDPNTVVKANAKSANAKPAKKKKEKK